MDQAEGNSERTANWAWQPRWLFVILAVVWSIFEIGIAPSASADAPPFQNPAMAATAGPAHPGTSTSSKSIAQTVQRQLEELKSWRATPQARKERASSRDSYRSESRQETAGLIREAFPSILSSDNQLVQPQDVKRYTSNYTAIVSPNAAGPPGGRTALAVSSLPLRTPSGSGGMQPVDLNLTQTTGGDLTPENPLVQFRLPQNLGEGITLPGGISMSMGTAERAGASPSTVGSDTALYPGVATDTDLVAAPLPDGVEISELLRSPQSPQSYELHLKLPAGDSLRSTGEGGAEVMNGDQALLSIAPPSATDAQGAAVPTSLQVEGDTLRLDVSHADDSWAYPILVDPTIVADNFNWYGGDPNFTGWTTFNDGAYSLSSDCMFGRECFGHGLNIYAWQGNSYICCDTAGFQYHPPAMDQGRSTYISELALGWVGYWSGLLTEPPYLQASISTTPDPTANLNNGFVNSYVTSYFNIDLVNQYDLPSVKYANFGLYNSYNHGIGADHHAFAGAAAVYLDDQDYPAFAPPSRPPWVDQKPAPFTVTASDGGLGISKLTMTGKTTKLDASGQPTTASWVTSANCTGATNSPCPKTWTSDPTQPGHGTINYDPSVLPQGVNNLPLTATDAGGHGQYDVYRLVEKYSNKCMDIRENRGDTAWPLQWDCDSRESQLFYEIPSSPGYVELVNRFSGKCLDLAGASPDMGAVLEQYTCLGPNQANQQFKLASAGGSTQLIVKHSGMCIGTGTTDNGYGYSQVPCLSPPVDFQLWNVQQVSSSSANIQIRVDHTNPTLALSGPLTTAASLGPNRPRYILHVAAGDGTTAAPQSGVTGATISVDGVQANANNPGCSSQNCALSYDWAFNSGSYATGHHTVTVTATDGVGRKTTKTVGIDISRDTTKPGLSVSGPLKTAPMGWVDQKNYTVTGASNDAGYGVTVLKLLIDNKQVQAATQTCPDGACSLSKTFTVNTATYGGGAHTVALVATDGANNSTTSTWTMNVNPDGNVSASEASSTIKAVDSTSASTVVAPSSQAVDPAELADGTNPALQQTGSTLQSAGTYTQATMTTTPASGFTLQIPGDSVHVAPTGVASSATASNVTNNVAAVSGDTASQVDSVVRPVYDGLMTFESIRDVTSPEQFSWQVFLDSGETLRSVDNQNAQVYYGDGTPAILITAEPAHDATGKTVPTALSVTAPNIITLTVSHHAGSYVYPIAAGPGWEAAYTVGFQPPAGDPITATETDPGNPIFYTNVGAPEVDRSMGGTNWKHRYALAYSCDTFGCHIDRQNVSAWFRYNGRPGYDGGQAIRGTVDYKGVGCSASGLYTTKFGHGHGWFGPNPAYYHLRNAQWVTAYCNWQLGTPVFNECPDDVCPQEHTEVHLFGDGNFDRTRPQDAYFCEANCDSEPKG